MEQSLKRYQQLVIERPELFNNEGKLKIELDIQCITAYMEETGRKLGVQYESSYHMLLVDLVYEERGRYSCYERVIKQSTGQGVVIVPKYKNKYVLLKQFRHALRTEQYSFPRGFGEDGLSGEENACKEIKEEIGAQVSTIQFLGNVVADSGLCGEEVAVYLAEVAEVDFEKKEEGIVEIVLLEKSELEDWVKTQVINDGYTLAAYAMCSEL